jgi:hypothetical protein
MQWDAFLDIHYRSHLVEIQPMGVAPEMAMLIVDDCLGNSVGNYSLQQRGEEVLVAFERSADAERFSRLLKATYLDRSAEWSSRSRARLNRAACRRLANASRRVP